MRMTNKIMRNNSAYNINQNKILQDKLTNQMTNQSKIVRPSDDPVVAIRALRLRSNVTAVSQYNDRNAKDAEQWLTLTADAMKTVGDVLDSLYKQASAAPAKFQTTDDLRIYLTQVKQLTAEFYSCANVDYAGRYVFSGYRTDLPVTFTEEDMKERRAHPVSYNIDEEFGFQDIRRINYTDFDKLRENLGGTTGPTTAPGITDTDSYEQHVKNSSMYSFRISYNNLDSLTKTDMAGNPQKMTITIPEYKYTETDTSTTPPTVTDYTYNNVKLEITVPAGTTAGANGGLAASVNVVSAEDAAGNKYPDPTATPPVTTLPPQLLTANTAFGDVQEFSDQEAAYKAIADGTCTGIAYIPTSGELVFSEDFYKANFSENAFKDGKSFQVNYDKSEWETGDINPVHYFNCVETINTAAEGETAVLRKTWYNSQRDEGRNQDIYYDVGYNQQIQVNTRADEIFTHDVQRDLDDFQYYLKQLEDIDKLKTDLETKQKEYAEDSDEYKDLALRIAGADKAWGYIREDIHTKFENQISKYQKYQEDSQVAMTDNATRGSRLDLISTRLTNQKATFKELQQDNEGIDITEVAVELTASELTYNAALMATGKIMQTNLMNYI